MMAEANIERIKSAIETQQQDDEALSLYWEFIQTETQSTTPYAPEQVRDALIEAYRLLYTAWQARKHIQAFDELIEAACHRRFSDVGVLSLLAKGEFAAARYQNALKMYDRLLTLKALDAETYQQLKFACFHHRPFDDLSNLLLQRCLKEYPQDRTVVQFMFSQYLLTEKYKYSPFAPTVYAQILEQEPQNLTVRSALCECYYRQGKYEQAIAVGEAGFEYEKHHSDILATLAKVHYTSGEYGRVVTYCRDVLTKHPGRTDVLVLLATVYARNALTTNEATKYYCQALQCVPQDLFIRQALFRSYLRKLQVDEAIAESEQIVTGLYDQYGSSHREYRATLHDMISEYERAIRRAPDDIALYLITAKLYEAIGHFHKALIYYRTLLELPLERTMLYKLIELLEKLATFQVQNPHLYLYLGLLYHKIERAEEAKLAFRAAMYADLDEHEVEDILVRHDRSIWQYPAVLVILAHHRIVTKDILDGLLQTFRLPDREDWEGVLWVLQELYEIDDLLFELRQIFTWETFPEIYPQILPILGNNGSRLAIQLLRELLGHANEHIRMATLHLLFQMTQPLAQQCLTEVANENPYPDIRLELAGYYAQQETEQATYHLMNMLHDEDANIRLYVAQSLQGRDVQVKLLHDVLFTERHPLVKTEIIRLFEQTQEPEERLYLAHLLNDLTAKRYQEGSSGAGKMYTRLKQLIGQTEKPEETTLLLTLIQAIGQLHLEQGMYSLNTIAVSDRSPAIRLAAIQALGQIGSQLAMPLLQNFLHDASESQELRLAAEQALDRIVTPD
ncbi:hypothetical protein U27_02653 [Candidatus Vecturithrix granuli]|uniref:Tetratricopeptide repeat protein n=1 Tax=Vecturithrix granuli TaxID=1499967 RepID=A0A081BTP1_VECG1|nr:hypothetical protein U27_02653 [Candidatus Vecturithrix granuli]